MRSGRILRVRRQRDAAGCEAAPGHLVAVGQELRVALVPLGVGEGALLAARFALAHAAAAAQREQDDDDAADGGEDADFGT